MKRSHKRSCTRLCTVVLALSSWLCAIAPYHTHKPLPDSLDYKGDTFLLDTDINVVITGLNKLRDSNFTYSAVWRGLLQWLGRVPGTRWLNHPVSGDQKVLLGSCFDPLLLRAYLDERTGELQC